MEESHLIDDYTLSRNIARYGLKFDTLINLQQTIGDTGDYLWHIYTDPEDVKLTKILEVMQRWNLIRSEVVT